MNKEPVPVTRPVELEAEEEYDAIAAGLLAEARAFATAHPGAAAAEFVRAVGRRRWMSRFADYWNIPEDEQLTRREVSHIDRFLTEIYAAAQQAAPERS